MATIEDWQIDPASYMDNRLGLAGRLFETCLNLLAELIKGPAKDCLELDAYQHLQAQAQRFSLWGDGFGAYDGGLDDILGHSNHLRKTILYFLSAFGGALAGLASSKPSFLRSCSF
jgi:hypothetical protein